MTHSPSLTETQPRGESGSGIAQGGLANPPGSPCAGGRSSSASSTNSRSTER